MAELTCFTLMNIICMLYSSLLSILRTSLSSYLKSVNCTNNYDGTVRMKHTQTMTSDNYFHELSLIEKIYSFSHIFHACVLCSMASNPQLQM